MTPTTLALLSVLLGGGCAYVIHLYRNREQFVPLSKVPERWKKLPKVECGIKERFR